MTLGDRSDASADREALLALLLADEGIELASTAIGRRDREQPAVLSFAQERMWFLDQFEEDTTALGVRTAVAMHGPLDVPVLRRCLDEIARRHDVLRTVIVADGGQPRAVVLPVAPMPVVEYDVHGDLAALSRILEGEAARTFDLEHEPPILVTIVRVAEDHHVLSVVMHHVASDGWSLAVFFRELAALYGALRDGLPSPLPEPPVQYEDYAWWQRHGASEVFERQLEYWRRQLAGPLPVCEIPTDHRRPARQTFAGGQVSVHLPSALVARLEDLGKRCGATLFMTMLAAFEVVVARHAGQREVLIGTPVAGRVRPELEPMIGAFLNTLVIRDDLGGDPSFRTVLERVRATSLDAFDNQDVPFELLLADLKPPRDLSRTPLFQIFFNMTNLDVGGTAFDLPGIRSEVVEQPDIGSKFDLTMYVNNGGDGVDLLLVYNRSLFEHSHMERLVAQYVHVLEQVVADPDQHIEELSLVAPHDAAVVPDAGCALDRTWHGSVPNAVRRIAARSPERVAVVDRDHCWTFALLGAHMNRLATWLKLRGLGRGEIVAIYAHRSGSLVWTVAGVLASGGVYLLLDPRYPPTRLAQLLRIARPTAFLALDAAGAPPPEVLNALDELRVEHRLTIPEIADPDELDRLLWDAGGDASGAPVDEDVPFDDDIGPDDPACLTFTSGSTGVPKAVVGRHGSLTHFFPWMSDRFGVGEDDRFSMLSGLAHDPLQREMFWPLWLGATVVVPEPESIPDPGWLAGWMREQQISVAHFTPAMGQLLTDGAGPGGRGTHIPSLRTALFIGDVLTRGEVARLHAVAPNVRVVNLYGTTETQRASGYHVLDEEIAIPSGTEAREVLPLGIGMPGAQLLVRTRTGAPAGIGEVGEIVMRSPHLALGYWDDADLTALRFLPDPAGTHPADQCYATGDLGRYQIDGSVEFLGRGDQQVKLRGFRIELGEIEAALREHEAVGDAVVELRDDGSAGAELVAYVVPAASGRVDGPELLRSTRARLPAHLVPAHVVVLDRIPMTPNGKLDRRALPPPGPAPARTDGVPRDALERLLVDVWERVLGRKGISVHDDFFALGGYSLLATRLFAVVEDRTGHRVPVSVLFEHPTIAELAAVIRDGGWRTNWSSLVPIQSAGSAQPFFYVAPYSISVLQLAPLGDELGRDRPLYGFQPQGLDGTLPAHPRIEDMAAHYITEMKTVQPQGPYALGGHCSGAWVAFEMARQLEAAGDEISALLLVDQGPPGVDPPKMEPKRYIANRLRFYLHEGRLRHAMAWQFKILSARLLLRRVGPRAVRFEEEVKAVHRQAFRAYGGGQISQDMTLVCSAESLALADKSWYTRWTDRTSGRLTTRHVAGTHANLLVQPYVAELGREVKRAMGEEQDDVAPAREREPYSSS